MRMKWNIIEHDYDEVRRFSSLIKVEPIIGALLISRGFGSETDAERFLRPDASHLNDPFLLKDMERSVGRILRGIDGGEKILVWGDYDVDGTTGTVVLRKALDILGGISEYHVPHRFLEGYGINVEGLKAAKDRGVSLVISVDTGSRAFEAAEWAQKNSIDLIITDHHLSDPERGNPDAFAVVNPNQPGCPYPDKHLAGVGVAYKLAEALLKTRGKDSQLEAFLKMVAIGTVADIMQLKDENRAIVAIGLRDLPRARNHGLRALMEVAGCTSEMSSYDIGFRIAPRINAAGRMDAATEVVKLFEAKTFDEARAIAEKLDIANRERQKVQAEISEKALAAFVDDGGTESQPHVAVVAGEGWHRGVIGLASSRITDSLHRPSLVISIEDGIGHGSARSIEGFDLHSALEHCRDSFEKFGGHAAACGFMIREENIESMTDKINAYAAGVLTSEILERKLRVDAVVKSKTVTLDLVESLKKMEPYGAGNPKPCFVMGPLELVADARVMAEKHLKLKLADSDGRVFEAVWWSGVEKSEELNLSKGGRIQLAFTPEANQWNGSTRLQLIVEDLVNC